MAQPTRRVLDNATPAASDLACAACHGVNEAQLEMVLSREAPLFERICENVLEFQTAKTKVDGPTGQSRISGNDDA